MSIQALNWALNQDQIANPNTRFVLLVLCNYADENGQCYPSRQILAKKTSMSVRSVQRQINWLADNGYITWTNAHNGKHQTPNIYQLQGDIVAPSEPKQGDKCDIAGCQTEQKQGDTVAQHTSEENHHKNTKEDVIEIFDFWKATMSLNGSTKLTSERKTNIVNRLKDYSVDRVKDAILGCSITPWNQGDNPNKTKYLDIELICRKGSKLEAFEQTWLSRPQPKQVSDESRKMRESLKASQEMFYGQRNS